MKKIKLCFLIVNCKITGPMNQTLNIIKNIDRKKFEICFVTLFDEEKENSMIDDYKKICNEHYCLHLNKIKSLIYGKYKLKKILKYLSPDIIHSLGMPAYRMSLIYKSAKKLVTLRNYPYDDYPSYYNKIIGPIMAFFDLKLIKNLYKKDKVFVTCSKNLSDIYKKRQNINFQYICNGVDIKKYYRVDLDKKNELRKKLNLPLNKIIFIYTAPFNERKNQDFAISAFLESKYKNDGIFILCGNGNKLNELKEKYYDYKNVVFTGKIKNIPDYLQASDIYLSSSKSEGLPNSVLEAMAIGLPIILSDIPQHMEFFEISNNIGYYYENGNLSDLVKKINDFDIKKISFMSDNSYEMIINNFSDTIMGKKYQNLYEKIYK